MRILEMCGSKRVAMRGKAWRSGFTLIELMIVMAIIFLVVAIALPHLLSARNKANEASAIASMKAVQAAESVYQNTYPARGFSPSLANLGNNGSTCEIPSPTNACLIDPLLASGSKDGYLFDLLGDGQMPDRSYTLKATPQSSNSGACALFTDENGVIGYGSREPTGGLSAGGGSDGRCSGTVN